MSQPQRQSTNNLQSLMSGSLGAKIANMVDTVSMSVNGLRITHNARSLIVNVIVVVCSLVGKIKIRQNYIFIFYRTTTLLI